MAALPANEIMALARIIGELDYYQLLHVERDVQLGDLRKAYHASSRSFHPDANHSLEPELMDAMNVIAKRTAEAYSVLRDPQRRQAYDRHLDSGQGVRMQLAQALDAAGRHAQQEFEGRTPQGRQFYKAATADILKTNWSAAQRNLQTALTFEPDNALFEEKLAEVRSKV